MTTGNNSWLNKRQSGVLAHISSLPGNFGIGNLGEGARRFIDFLTDTGFHYWQICPLGPIGYGDSPYQSFSTYAGNPYFLDIDTLIRMKLLTWDEVEPLLHLSHIRVEYGELYEDFWPIMEKAYERFDPTSPPGECSIGWEAFISSHRDWLRPYGLFMGLKKFHGGKPWTKWKSEYQGYKTLNMEALPDEVLEEQNRQEFYQYCFYNQWQDLKAHANSKGIEIIGDLPVFVAHDSADVWQDPEVFQISKSGELEVSSGVPPDYFSESGQYWGNPLYNWEVLKKQNYQWWINRFKGAFELYDVIRIDHFRAFSSYCEIPGDATDARKGRWKNGPGIEFFATIQKHIPVAKLIAEDLGYIDEDVYKLRKATGLPGMKILQFGYGHDTNNVNLPHYFPAESVVYTGTHDNDTTRGWLEKLAGEVEQKFNDYYQLEGVVSAWPLVRAAFMSVSNLAVVPIQDLMDLESVARMNSPGTPSGNWQWRFTAEQLEMLKKKKGQCLIDLHTISERTSDEKQHNFSAPPGE